MTDTDRMLIDAWFPCTSVDRACGGPAGSGKNEKAIFTWFASRPIAQARAAVATALLPDAGDHRQLVDAAVLGDASAIEKLAGLVADRYPEGRPVVLDVFSGRGIIPLEAARIGATAVGLDLSPVATLAGRVLADYPLRDWSAEPALPWTCEPGNSDALFDAGPRPRLIADLEIFLAEVGRRLAAAVEPYYPRSPDGSFPWGYLWAISIPCDACGRRFPLLGSLALRHPYTRTNDVGQSLNLVTNGDGWRVEVIDGLPRQAPTYSATELAGGRKRKGKSARCLFCQHPHSLEAVKAKGFAGEYRDEILVAADTVGETRKVFRELRDDERAGARCAESAATLTEQFGPYSAIPDETIAVGNVHTVMASGYGYRSFGELMCVRQLIQFVEAVRAIRACHAEVLAGGCSEPYGRALAGFASAMLVRMLKHATRGAGSRPHGSALGEQQNRVQVNHIFANESKVAFQFDWFEAGVGDGPGTWSSLIKTGLKPYETHVLGLRGVSARLRMASAMALPYRDGSVDAVITDPPYYDMIEYADASDLFHVWLKRALFDIEPDLFGPKALRTRDGLQDKNDEIIVRRVHEPGRVRHDKQFYENSLAKAFDECRRVLRADGHLVVVFGHSDPDAWKRLLAALHEARFVVTSSWPSRTESANTGVASIKVTVTIGCRVAAPDREPATVAQVDREVVDAVKARVPCWAADGLALADQMMAAYGPAMEVYGRYATALQPDGQPAELDRYLTLARRAVREATALRLDEIPIETFDPLTRFAVFWLRMHGSTVVAKGEARFMAQVDNLRLEDVRAGLLEESKAGFRLILGPPPAMKADSSEFDVARGMAAALAGGGTDAAAELLASWGRSPSDEHLWAVIGELVAQLPASDTIAKALTGLQRNASVVQNRARGVATSRAEATPPDQLNLLDLLEDTG